MQREEDATIAKLLSNVVTVVVFVGVMLTQLMWFPCYYDDTSPYNKSACLIAKTGLVAGIAFVTILIGVLAVAVYMTHLILYGTIHAFCTVLNKIGGVKRDVDNEALKECLRSVLHPNPASPSPPEIVKAECERIFMHMYHKKKVD
ncbi:MAG: hypothetical protein WC763_05895 [Candidatus Paceibacterota bacterium]|jgi:hypothetical protein